MPRIRIDASSVSSLVICECGFRELVTTYPAALRIAVAHETAVHPAQRQAYQMAFDATRRTKRDTQHQ